MKAYRSTNLEILPLDSCVQRGLRHIVPRKVRNYIFRLVCSERVEGILLQENLEILPLDWWVLRPGLGHIAPRNIVITLVLIGIFTKFFQI